ncbi:MAG: hypothetical protein VYA18_06200, partial [Pseudomonadota bacterium]|nr:hypothetical protein [Pseudomonadota bacterium]
EVCQQKQEAEKDHLPAFHDLSFRLSHRLGLRPGPCSLAVTARYRQIVISLFSKFICETKFAGVYLPLRHICLSLSPDRMLSGEV